MKTHLSSVGAELSVAHMAVHVNVLHGINKQRESSVFLIIFISHKLLFFILEFYASKGGGGGSPVSHISALPSSHVYTRTNTSHTPSL